jgi:P4 family phage/plasmid primase-like protien
VITGIPSGIFGADFDKPETFRSIFEDHKDKPNTFTVKTAKGYHLYYKLDPRLGSLTVNSNVFKGKYEGVDFRCNGGYLVCPTSINGGCGDTIDEVKKCITHKQKGECKALTNRECIYRDKTYDVVEYREINDMPEWLVQMFLEASKVVPEEKKEKIERRSPQRFIKKRCVANPKYYENNQTMIRKLLDDLDAKRWDDYMSWFKLMTACHSIGVDKEYVRLMSKKSKKYDDVGFDSVWENFDPEKAHYLGRTYLLNCLKLDIGDEKYQDFRVLYLIRDNKLYNTLMTEDDKGIAKIFLSNVNKIYKALDKETIYYFNEDTFLYEHIDIMILSRNLSDVLSPLIKQEIEVEQSVLNYRNSVLEMILTKEETKETTKKKKSSHLRLKTLFGVLRSICSKRGCSDACYFFLTYIQDKKFFELLDHDNNTLPLRGGKIIDATGNIRDRTINDLWSWEFKLDYLNIPISKCRTMMKFIKSLVKNDVVEYLLRVLGYSLTAETSEKIMMVYVGTGNNGKTSFLNCIQRCFGDNDDVFTEIDPKIMKEGKGSNVGPELLKMRTTRIGLYTEPDNGTENKLNEGNIKKMTGNGDKFSCRALFSNKMQTITPMVKIHACVNNLPSFSGHDQAMVNRLREIVFPHRFEITDANKAYVNDVVNDHSNEMLNIMINQWLKYKRSGLPPVPESMKISLNEYRLDNDPIGAFIEANCEFGEDKYLPCSVVCEAINSDNSKNEVSQHRIGKIMKAKGFSVVSKRREGRTIKMYKGLCLKEEQHEEEGEQPEMCGISLH